MKEVAGAESLQPACCTDSPRSAAERPLGQAVAAGTVDGRDLAELGAFGAVWDGYGAFGGGCSACAMNYFAHAYRFLDDPPLVVGTAVPDWLMVCDRGVRLRARHAAGPANEWLGPARQLARGILQHLGDDAVFHNSDAFAESQLAVAGVVRRFVDHRAGLSIGLLSHLILELLLDAALIAEAPGRLEAYYRGLESVDAGWVQRTVNRLAPRPSSHLAEMMVRFRRARILWDYLEDARLLRRLNQVLARTGLEGLPEGFCAALAEARPLVAAHRHRLLAPGGQAGAPISPG